MSSPDRIPDVLHAPLPAPWGPPLAPEGPLQVAEATSLEPLPRRGAVRSAVQGSPLVLPGGGYSAPVPQPADEPSPDPGPVGPDSLIAQVMLARPDAERVLYEEFGLPCYRCVISLKESVAEGARLYGLDPARVVARLNECPPRPLAPSPPPAAGGAA